MIGGRKQRGRGTGTMPLSQSFTRQNNPSKGPRGDKAVGGDSVLDRSIRSQSQESNSTDENPAPGVYDNGRIVYTMGTLFGSVVQVLLSNEKTYEGVLKTFSPEFEIVLDAVTVIDPKSSTEGGNIGHLISSLAAGEELLPTKVFNLKDVVRLDILNTDMDYASRGHLFATDTELSKGRVDTSEERTLVPWTADEPESACDTLESSSGVNGWTAEEMFAQNKRLRGIDSGFQPLNLDGTYTIALQSKDTPEAKEREKYAADLARSIEDNAMSRRRVEKENSDDRDEEEKYSAVVRPGQQQPPPQQGQQQLPQHPIPPHMQYRATKPSRSGEDMNWRSTASRSQNMKPQAAAFQKTPYNNAGPRDQRPGHLERRDSRDDNRGVPPKRQNFPQLQGQTPQNLHHQQQPLISPQQHQQMQHQHQSMPQGPPQHRSPLSSQASITSPKDELPKVVLQGNTPPSSTPNYARAVAQDQDQRSSNKTSITKEQQRRAEQLADIHNTMTEMKITPDADKKDVPPTPAPPTSATSAPVVPVVTQASAVPAEPKKEVKAEEPKVTLQTSDQKSGNDTDVVETIAKTSKLNPNAKEFTFNPDAKPFTPRVANPPTNVVVHPVVAQPQTLQPVPTYNQVHQVPVSTPYGQGHQQPHISQFVQHGMPRMSGNSSNQPVLLQQATMVSPAGNFVSPYGVLMQPQYQQMPINQSIPGPGGAVSGPVGNQTGGRPNKGYKNQNHNNRNDHQNFTQNSQHVAHATGHPVLAAYPPGQIFNMYQVHPGFNTRMPHHVMNPQVPYDPSHGLYMNIPGTIPMVPQAMTQQNNGQHSNPPTPQSQTPTTPGMHGTSTPGPGSHAMVAGQSQTPTPQQAVMFSGQNLPPHSVAGAFNSQHQNMVLMQGHPGQPQHPQGPGSVQHPGVTHGHPMMPVIQPPSATPLVMQGHYQQNQR